MWEQGAAGELSSGTVALTRANCGPLRERAWMYRLFVPTRAGSAQLVVQHGPDEALTIPPTWFLPRWFVSQTGFSETRSS